MHVKARNIFGEVCGKAESAGMKAEKKSVRKVLPKKY